MVWAPPPSRAAVVVSPKVRPRVAEQVQSEPVIPVFIVLKHQPQREIVQQAEGTNALYRQAAEARYRQAAWETFPAADELRQAREAVDAAVLRTRQQAFRAIEQAIKPEQDVLESRLKGLGATRIFRYLGINMLAAEIPRTAIGALEADPVIAQVFPVEKQYAQLANSVPALGAPAFWAAGYTGQGESVGILDSGVRTDHPAFAGVPIVSQVFLSNGSTDSCFADNASSPQDQQGHGTFVAGVVASRGSAGWTNYLGVAKGLGKLYNLKVGYETLVSSACSPTGVESDGRDVLAALDWAVANTPVTIFNYSYGSPTTADDDPFAQAIDQYIDTYRLTVTIAAGNGGPDTYKVTSPGIAYNGITVGNADDTGAPNQTSSPGPTAGGRDKPDLEAPGTNVCSLAYNWDATPGTGDDFTCATGTSAAAPHIAGAAALLGSAGVTDPLAVRALLINTTGNFEGWLDGTGWGFANLNTTLSQMNYATGSLAAGQSQFYYMPSHTGIMTFATVTWNRHVSGGTPYLNHISLALYNADQDNASPTVSSSPIQNVQQVTTPFSGDAMLVVTMNSSPLGGVTSEPYAIAFNVPTAAVTGPQLGVSCNLPSSVASGAQFTMSCTVANTGGMTANAVTGQAVLPAGFTGASQISFGDVPAGAVSSAGTLVLTAPSAPGTYAMRMTASAYFGVSSTGSFTTVVQPALPPPVLEAPANGATGVSAAPALTWQVAPGASVYQVYLGTTLPPPLVTSTSETTYTPPSALAPGTQYYWWIVALNGSGSSSSAVWSFTTQAGPAQAGYIILTVAGNGSTGVLGDGGPATSASLYEPEGVAVDAAGNLYIADTNFNRIRKVSADGTISTVAGNGSDGYLGDGGPATIAVLNLPNEVAVDAAGNLYIADTHNSRIRMVTPAGTITTFAGGGSGNGLGDGGPATSAMLYWPNGVLMSAGGTLYIGDTYDHRVREVTSNGIITTLAGTGSQGYGGDGGPAASAQLNQPGGLAMDPAGNVYVADSGNNRVRKIAPDGTITTVAGCGCAGPLGDGGPATSASLAWPSGVAVDAAGNLYIADYENNRVRRVDPSGTIRTVAGNGMGGFSGDGGPAASAELWYPGDVAVDAVGDVFIADGGNFMVRELLPMDPSCQFQIDQTSVALPGAGGTVSISLQTTPACIWGVAGLPSWIAGQSWGRGPAPVKLTVASNPGALRNATISVGNTAVTITQGEAACSYSLGSSSGISTAAGSIGSVAVLAGPSCPWLAAGSADWVTLSQPAGGIGGATLAYTVAPNTGAARSTTLTIAGLPYTIQQDGLSTTGLAFVPVAPCRVADTRYARPTMAAGESRAFEISGNCGIPSTAQAYSLNVTVVPQGPLSYLTLWPTGQPQPLVSTLNSFGGIVVANAAIVPAGFNGAVSVFVTDPTDVILDTNGYFDSPGSYAFYPVQPCRVADTRFGNAPPLAGGQSRDFALPASGCGLPAGAAAYSMNVTVVPQGYLGYLSIWPAGQAQPLVSTLNSWTGKIVANAALVPAGTNGSVSAFAEDTTDVILDTNGYFGAPGGTGGLNFYPVTPCRVADTRFGGPPFGGPEMGSQETRSFPIPASTCNIPSTAQAYALNVTVVPDGRLQYLTVWPAGSPQPLVSTLNSFDGSVVANAAIVPAGTDGAISVYVTDRTHVILDINGYFGP